MTSSVITAVAGPPGAGKTTWICQQLTDREILANNSSTKSVLYLCPTTSSVPIDQTRLATEFPQVQILGDGQESQLLKQLDSGASIYIELGFHLDLSTISQMLDSFPSRRVAIVPPGTEKSEWHDWAEEIVEGGQVSIIGDSLHLWRSPTTGQVIDFDSLDVFWYELTQGAYGNVHRAKGIFDIADGLSLYGDFVAGLEEKDFEQLNFPRWLKGRPQRFSGVEILGHNLNVDEIGQTLRDCCLSESAIFYYQQQVKETLELPEEAIV